MATTTTTRNWPRRGKYYANAGEIILYNIYNKNCRCSRCGGGGGGRTRGDLCIFYHYLPSRKTFPGTDSRRAFHFSTPSPTTCLHNISRPRPLHAAHSTLRSHLLYLKLPPSLLRGSFFDHAFDPATSSMLFI